MLGIYQPTGLNWFPFLANPTYQKERVKDEEGNKDFKLMQQAKFQLYTI